ncbi:proteoglycan 4-like [Ylistrum balloti]|uniref:proteoglycan 4-like n=1 Tax=Ylistrum balloti TaxID=509963 RepID=UPI002905E1E9|nr:proteoglycan 4-like [Ylistrum balloti]
MDVPILFSILVTMHVCGVLSLSPMMNDMNADIMNDIMNLRRKIKNHQRTLSSKVKGKENSVKLPAAEIAMREFFLPSEGEKPKTDKNKSPISIKDGSKKDVSILESQSTGSVLPGRTKSTEKSKKSKKSTKIDSQKVSETNAKAAGTIPNEANSKLSQSSSKKDSTKTATEIKSKTPSTQKQGADLTVSATKAPVVKATTTSDSKSTRRSRRRSSRRRKSRKSRKSTTTPSPSTTAANPTTDLPKVVNNQKTPTPSVALAPTPGNPMQTTMSHILREGPVMLASMLARLYPRLMGLFGGVRNQAPNMDPVMMNGGHMFNNPTLQGEIFRQSQRTQQSNPIQQQSPQTSHVTNAPAQLNHMQLYMQDELCSETPSRFVTTCSTNMDCKYKLKCYSGYCCANSHRHAEMLDNMPEYIGMPHPWRSFFR